MMMIVVVVVGGGRLYSSHCEQAQQPFFPLPLPLIIVRFFHDRSLQMMSL